MDQYFRRKSLSLPIASSGAGIAALGIAVIFACMPVGLLETLVDFSGIAAIAPSAEPPLGITARIVLILAGGVGAGVLAWLGLFLLFGTRRLRIGRRTAAPVVMTTVRREDAHPDAPPREPLRATRDLGAPFPVAATPIEEMASEVTALCAQEEPIPGFERRLPIDLDTPLAAYAMASPGTISHLPKARPQRIDPGDRFETFELTPMVRPAPRIESLTSPAATASIHDLLDRLERVVGRREDFADAAPERVRRSASGG